MSHSHTITPHGGDTNPPQYTQAPSSQPAQMPAVLPNVVSSQSELYSTYPGQGSGSGPQMPQIVSNPNLEIPPNPNVQNSIEQQYIPNPYPIQPGYPANPQAPNMQPQMYNVRQPNQSQVVIPQNMVLTASVPQMAGAPGEQVRPQFVQSYLPNQQQQVAFIMQSLPINTQQSIGYSLPKTDDLPKPVVWMTKTTMHLEDIPILGSNNSGFFMGEFRAQRVDIAEQLKFGIRFLDIAIVQYHDEIYLDQYKHIFDLECPYISISEALWSIRFFLERNNKEIIFLNLRSNSTKKAGENSDTIQPDLLEAKFRFIMKFIFDINDVKFNVSPGDLAESTKKNIICFTENTDLFSFLSNNNLSFSSSQLEVIPFLNFDIGAELKKAWIKPRKSNINISPQSMRFIWYIIDAVTPNSDADLLKSIWEAQYLSGVLPPFQFYSLCKVNKHTWDKFNSLTLYNHQTTN